MIDDPKKPVYKKLPKIEDSFKLECKDFVKCDNQQVSSSSNMSNGFANSSKNCFPSLIPADTYSPKNKSPKSFRILNSIFLIVIALALCGLVMAAYQGKFQSNINQQVEPQVNINSSSPVSIQNNYSQPITNHNEINIQLPSDLISLCKLALNYTNRTC